MVHRCIALGLLLSHVVSCRPALIPTRSGVTFAAYKDATPRELRTAFTRTLSEITSDVAWIEATLLDPAVVRSEVTERSQRMGLSTTEIAKRVETALARDDVWGVEIWMSTNCDRCLDLRNWSYALKLPGGEVLRPRWVESAVMRKTAASRRVLNVERALVRHWVRGRVVFPPWVPPERGTIELLASRPEGWDEPFHFRWYAGQPGDREPLRETFEQELGADLRAWLDDP